MAFALAGNLDQPSVISIKMEIAFAMDCRNIRLPIMEIYLCTAAGDLDQSKNQRDWTLRKAVLLPPFLAEATIPNRESDAGELLNIFTHSVIERVEEGEDAGVDDDDSNDESEGCVEAEE